MLRLVTLSLVLAVVGCLPEDSRTPRDADGTPAEGEGEGEGEAGEGEGETGEGEGETGEGEGETGEGEGETGEGEGEGETGEGEGEGEGELPPLDSDADGIVDTDDNCVFVANRDQLNTGGGAAGDACDDRDADGVVDLDDNCPADENADQLDTGGDVLGDVCDDRDDDGVVDLDDNCISAANTDQENTGGDDLLGDACDDRDLDGVLDVTDNCVDLDNADQQNSGGAATGDACEDRDGDGRLDLVDNCADVANANQRNSGGGPAGDACDDRDGDTVVDLTDNCVDTPNVDQTDQGMLNATTGVRATPNGIGDACDDREGDGVPDAVDNCPDAVNPEQFNFGGDERGDDCEDRDEDGILDIRDNCGDVFNPDQADTGGVRGIGNACDLSDADNDGVFDTEDNCVNVPNLDQKNTNGDPALGDACDPTDTDNDGVKDFADNCITVANANQQNTPGGNDALGDACEDRDGDGVKDLVDNCIGTPNANQSNVGGDARLGDACEDDDDGDGVLDTNDNCPQVSNADQVDGDRDGVGAACDTPGRTLRVMLTGNSNIAINFNAPAAVNLPPDVSTLAGALRGIAAGLPADVDRIEPVERVRYGNTPIQFFREDNRPCVSGGTSTSSNKHCVDTCRVAEQTAVACPNGNECSPGQICIGNSTANKRCANIRTELPTPGNPCRCLAAGHIQDCAPCAVAAGCREKRDDFDGQPASGTAPTSDFECLATPSEGCSPLASLQQQSFQGHLMQLLPFGNAEQYVAGGGLDSWRDAAVADGSDLYAFLPMVSSTSPGSITGNLNGAMFNQFLAYARANRRVISIPAGLAVTNAMGAALDQGRILEYFYYDSIPGLVTPPQNTGGGHPGAKAHYIYALTMYRQIFGRSVVGFPTSIPELQPAPCYWSFADQSRCEITPTEGRRLQEVVDAAVADWNARVAAP